MNDIKTGFIAPEITPDQYVFGAGNVGLTVIQEDGNWGPLLPIEETQNKGKFETFNCTAFGTTNAIELLLYKLTGERLNYSDRWVGIIAGTKSPGNDPHVVAEAIRKYGLIPEDMLPFSDDLESADEYYSFKGGDKEACYRAGREWLAKYDFKHEWTFTPGQPIVEQINNMKVALKGSPQCIGVFAWASNDKDVYYKNGGENHWTTVYNINEFMNVFDSYQPFRKNVDQALQFCKRYSIALRGTEAEDPVKIGILRQIVNALLKLVGLYQEQVAALPKKSEEQADVKKPLDWSTTDSSRHSVRVICDEEKLSVQDKNDLCATVGAESGWRKGAIGSVNSDGSRDYGIVQVNDEFWIGKGMLFPSIQYVLDNPEACVRWMCREWKKGHRNWWYGFKTGAYKRYL